MNIELPLKTLSEAVNAVSRAVASRPQLPVLSNILLEASQTGLKLSATDLEIGMTVFIPAKVIETGRVTVPAKLFVDYLSSLKNEKLSVHNEDSKLVIEAGSFRGEMQTISAEEFPTLPSGDGTLASVEVSSFVRALERVVFSAARDSLRPILTGVLFEFLKGKIQVVATDGFRLAMVKVKAQSEFDLSIVIPSRAVQEIIRIARDGEFSIVYLADSNQVVFRTGEVILMAQAMNGNFPDYARILPKDFSLKMSVPREDLLSAVSSVSIFARDNSNVMRWNVSENELSIIADASERGMAKAKCAVSQDFGETSSVAFNAKYVLDFLVSSKEEEVVIGLGEALSPGSFQEQGNNDYLYVVMPINV